MIAIIPCGDKKRKQACRAVEMYIGPYFRACYLFAMAQHPSALFILSAKYGLLTPEQVIEPYALRMGQPGCVGVEDVRKDAERLGIVGNVPLILGGRRYRDVLLAVFPKTLDPLAQVRGGIGSQMAWLNSRRGMVLDG